jgi:ABC-2 type transport system permease protein
MYTSKLKLWAFFRLGAFEALKNYKLLVGLLFFLVVCLLIFSYLWTEVLGVGKTFQANEFIWYMAFNEWILIATPLTYLEIERDIQDGSIVYHLTRPLSYLGSKGAHQFGTFLVAYLTLGLTAHLFAYLWTGYFPLSPLLTLAFWASGLLAGLLVLVFELTIGLTTLWLGDVEPVHWLFEKSLFLLGGLFVPPLFFPDWLRLIASFTPFPLVLGERSSILFGADFAFLSLRLLFWLTFAIILLAFTFRRAMKTLNIEGG